MGWQPQMERKMNTKTITMTLCGPSQRGYEHLCSNAPFFPELPRMGSFFMGAAMQLLNRGQEVCRELFEVDTDRRSYERRLIKEDAAKFRATVERQKREAFARLEAK